MYKFKHAYQKSFLLMGFIKLELRLPKKKFDIVQIKKSLC